MKRLQARVVKGRFVIDEPSPFPDGTVVELVIADEDGVNIGGEADADLRAALAQSQAEFEAGEGCDVEELAGSRKIVGRKK